MNIDLIKGDCLEKMKSIPDNSVDLITIDPPYGINYKSGWGDKFKKIENDDNLDFIEELFKELNRVSVDNSHIYCFVPIQNLDLFFIEIKKYWNIGNLITIPRTMKGGIGSLKSTFSSQNEFIIFGTKGKRNFEESKILKPSEVYIKDKRKNPKEWIYRLPDYWHWCKASEHNLKRQHPTQKTIDVFDTMIQVSSKKGDIVLDCFMGVCSSGVASLKNGRNFIGIELDDNYFDIATNRINTYIEENEIEDVELSISK